MYNFLLTVKGNGQVIISKRPGEKPRDEKQVFDHLINKIKKDEFTFIQEENLHQVRAQEFFKWIDKKFPTVNRISINERNELMKAFTADTGIYLRSMGFNTNLPENIIPKKISVRGETCHGYEIKNSNPKSEYFPSEYKFERK